MCFCVSVCHRMYACLCVHVKATKEFSYDCLPVLNRSGFKLDSCWVPPSTHPAPQHSFVSFPFCSSLLLLPVQFLFFSSFAVSSCLFASPSFPLSLYFSLSSLSYSFSFFHHILSFHVWMVEAHEFMDFCMGGSLPRETKMISQPAVWNMVSCRNRVGAQSTRQLFCSGPFSTTEGVAHLK